MKRLTEPRLISEEKGACPACGSKSFTIKVYYYKIPLVNDILITSYKCDNCGYRSSDVTAVNHDEPAKYILTVDNVEDLSALVVKTSKAILKIPELGIEIYPGPAACGYITTVDGVLERVLDVLPSECDEKCQQKKNKIIKAINGQVKFTLILEDHYGGSAIVYKKEKVKVEKI